MADTHEEDEYILLRKWVNTEEREVRSEENISWPDNGIGLLVRYEGVSFETQKEKKFLEKYKG